MLNNNKSLHKQCFFKYDLKQNEKIQVLRSFGDSVQPICYEYRQIVSLISVLFLIKLLNDYSVKVTSLSYYLGLKVLDKCMKIILYISELF